MWKVFSLALLATAAAIPTQTKDGSLQSPLMTKVKNSSTIESGTYNPVEAMCNKYGPKDAFKNYEQSLTNMKNGILATLSLEIKKDFENKKVSNYVSIACRSIFNLSFREQLENVILILKQCMDPMYTTLYDSNYKVIEFACSNDGEILTNFIKEGGIECYVNQLPKIEKCLKKLFPTLPVEPKKVSKLLISYKKCATEELRHCLSPPSVEFADYYFRSLFGSLLFQ